ncbi:reverse transcriptase-like protein [Candidatus Saccharibacteria bacterium]|nr:reverse transcriptase-like protein [Candidatus Saccharibacteria bacterium]
MKQRIRVVGIIKDKDDILFLKKNLGRADGSVIWELPTGKIRFGEQPEEAMTRIVYDDLGLQVSKIKLLDVITFLSLNKSSQLGNLYIVFEVSILENQKFALGDRYTAYKFIKTEEQRYGGVKLDDASLSVLEILYGRENTEKIKYRDVANSATVFVDGCSRGNPGPAGVGYYIVGDDGKVLKKGGEFIGFATSRVAEYFAIKEGCEQAIELGLKTVRFVSDNLMIVNQLNGVYKIKNKDIMTIYDDVQKLLAKFDACAFVHIKRGQNVDADREANLVVDRHFG